jgi:uncharacterized phage protein (TIGR01671 family)
MNREIKFRAWNPELQEYYNDIELQSLSYLRTESMLHSKIAMKMMYDFDKLLWMQFTGLKDKNGLDIYEGDIKREEIEFDEGDERYYYVCVWIKEWCMFVWLNIEGEYSDYIENGVINFDKPLFFTYPISEENIGIICGNIYQNPELLK